jgi:hypothetical protein
MKKRAACCGCPLFMSISLPWLRRRWQRRTSDRRRRRRWATTNYRRVTRHRTTTNVRRTRAALIGMAGLDRQALIGMTPTTNRRQRTRRRRARCDGGVLPLTLVPDQHERVARCQLGRRVLRQFVVGNAATTRTRWTAADVRWTTGQALIGMTSTPSRSTTDVRWTTRQALIGMARLHDMDVVEIAAE